jgi:type IV pilus assembly protein PilM
VLRSISHYCTEQRGARPERVFLSGGGAGTPGIREFFQEKLQMPVDFFDPLRKVAVADSAVLENMARRRHLLGEPVGLALRTARRCPMELNLRPSGVVRRQEMERRRPSLVLAAACFVLGLLGWGTYYACAAQSAERAAVRLEEKVNGLRGVETQMKTVQKEIAALDNVSAPLVAAINDRNFWPGIIEDLNARLPKEDIWITELVPVSSGKPLEAFDLSPARADVTSFAAAVATRPAAIPAQRAIDGLLVRGLYLFNPRQQEVVVDYFRNLVGSPWFALDPGHQAKVIKPTTPNNEEWAFPYELHLELRKPVPLP